MKLVSKFENIAGYEHPNKKLPDGQSYLLLDERSDNKNRTGATFMQTLAKDGGTLLGAIFKNVAVLKEKHRLLYTPDGEDNTDALFILNAVAEEVTDNRISHNTYLHSHVVIYDKTKPDSLQHVLDENSYAQRPLGSLNDLLPTGFEKDKRGSVSIFDVPEDKRGTGFHKLIVVDKKDVAALAWDETALERVSDFLLTFGKGPESRTGLRLVLDTQNFSSYTDKKGYEQKVVALHMLGDFKEEKIDTPKGKVNRRWFDRRQNGPSAP